ncbi:MAG: cyclase family protein [Aggregatilineales bacterium]
MLYDVTRTISPAISVWPGDSLFQIEQLGQIAMGDSVNLTTLHMSAHTGTHADAWWHCSDEGVRIGDMPLDRYIGPAQVLSVLRASGGIMVSDLAGTDLTGAERVLFHTPVSELADDRWPDPFPYLTVELVDFLADHGIKLIGLDSPSVDAVDSKTLPCHQRLRIRGLANLENLQLRAVPDGRYELMALPLRLAGACGSPVRAVLRSL